MNEIQISDLRRRLDTVVKSMIADSKIGTGKENYESVYNRDYDVNKFAYVMLRVIRRGMEKPSVRKSLGVSILDLVFEQLAVLSMERVADRAKRISRADATSKITKQEIAELNKIYEIIAENYNQSVRAYKNKDYKLSCLAFSSNKKIQNMCGKIRQKLRSDGAYRIIGLLREMSQRVSELGEVGFMNADSTISKKTLEQPIELEQEKIV